MSQDLQQLNDPSVYPTLSHEPDERLLKLVAGFERQMQDRISRDSQRRWLMTLLAAAAVAVVCLLVLRWFWVDALLSTAWTALLIWSLFSGLNFAQRLREIDQWADQFDQLYPPDSPLRQQALRTLWELGPPSLGAYILHERVAPIRRMRWFKPLPAPPWVGGDGTP